MENTYDVSRHIVDYHRVTPNDCMIIISNSATISCRWTTPLAGEKEKAFL